MHDGNEYPKKEELVHANEKESKENLNLSINNTYIEWLNAEKSVVR